MHELGVAIVSYNTKELLIDCLRSLLADLQGIDSEVWLVDNASMDGTVEAVREQFPGVEVIANSRNVGFAAANNQALRKMDSRIWVLLNSDTIVLPGACAAIVTAFGEDEGLWGVVPQLLNPERTLQPSWGRFATASIEWAFQLNLYKVFPVRFPLGSRVHAKLEAEYCSAHAVDWGSGACLAVRAAAGRRVGLLDESNFMYGEDMEWCWRIRKAGGRIAFRPEAQIVHLNRASSRRDYARWIENYTRAQLGFIAATGGRASARAAGLAVMTGSLLRIAAFAGVFLFQAQRRQECRQRIAGYGRALRLGARALAKGGL